MIDVDSEAVNLSIRRETLFARQGCQSLPSHILAPAGMCNQQANSTSYNHSTANLCSNQQACPEGAKDHP
jgi:hypothetical protein